MRTILMILSGIMFSCATAKIYENDQKIDKFPDFFKSPHYIVAELKALARNDENGRFWVLRKAEIGKHLGIIQIGEAGEMQFLPAMAKSESSKQYLQSISNCYPGEKGVDFSNENYWDPDNKELKRITVSCRNSKNGSYIPKGTFVLDPKEFIFMEDALSQLSKDIYIFHLAHADIAYLLTKDPEKLKMSHLSEIQKQESDSILKNISKESLHFINSNYGYKGWESFFTAFFNPIENPDIENIYRSIEMDEFSFHEIEQELKSIREKKYILIKNTKSPYQVRSPGGGNWEVSSYDFKTKSFTFNYETESLTIKPFSVKMEPTEAQEFIKDKKTAGEFKVLAKIKLASSQPKKKIILEPIKWDLKWKGKAYGNAK